MNVPEMAKAFFRIIDEEIGPFDRPIQFRPFPFDAGGALNFLTVGANRDQFVTYVSWDLFGHPEQKRGSLGRYELLAVTDQEDWCLDILTRVGRQSLKTVFEPGDTLDIAPWTPGSTTLRGIIFDVAFKTHLGFGACRETCGLLRCIGVTREELAVAVENGTPALIECLKAGAIYPRTIVERDSVNLPHR